MRYDQWWECKFIAEGIIDQGEAPVEHKKNPPLVSETFLGLLPNEDKRMLIALL